MKFETQAIRIQTEPTQNREHSTPIFPTSSFVFENADQMQTVFAGEEKGNIYSRFTNPSVREFELKIAALERAENAIATASGMSAVFTTFVATLEKGDHLLISRAVFGSTFKMAENFLGKWGIEYSYLNPNEEIEKWEEEIKGNSKMLFIETPSNPGLQIFDIEKIAHWAHKQGLIFAVDNCFATPYLQKPLTVGADIVVHSATKFIDGQGRVLGGAVAGSNSFIEKAFQVIRNLGPSLSPFNAWILSKSLETLAVRMDRHCLNAMKLATFLQSSQKIKKVNYPFLQDHPQFQIAKKQMKAGGGIVTFDLVRESIAKDFLNHLKMISLTANLGDSRTIASHPYSTTHRKLSETDKEHLGIGPGLIRISVGLEHIDDIIEDISQSLTNM